MSRALRTHHPFFGSTAHHSPPHDPFTLSPHSSRIYPPHPRPILSSPPPHPWHHLHIIIITIITIIIITTIIIIIISIPLHGLPPWAVNWISQISAGVTLPNPWTTAGMQNERTEEVG